MNLTSPDVENQLRKYFKLRSCLYHSSVKNNEVLLRYLRDIYSDASVHVLPCVCYKFLKHFTYEIVDCLQDFKLLPFAY